MLKIGQYNKMKVLKSLDFGIYLDGGNGLEILMPTRYIPENTEIGDEINCFVYLDSEDSLARLRAPRNMTPWSFALSIPSARFRVQV